MMYDDDFYYHKQKINRQILKGGSRKEVIEYIMLQLLNCVDVINQILL